MKQSQFMLENSFLPKSWISCTILKLHLLPLGVYSGTYRCFPYTWVVISCASPVHHILSGVYSWLFGWFKYLLSVVYCSVDWFPLLIGDIDVALNSKSVTKPCLNSPTKIGSTLLFLRWSVLDPCWDIFEPMHLASAIGHYSLWFTYHIQASYGIIHSSSYLGYLNCSFFNS